MTELCMPIFCLPRPRPSRHRYLLACLLLPCFAAVAGSTAEIAEVAVCAVAAASGSCSQPDPLSAFRPTPRKPGVTCTANECDLCGDITEDVTLKSSHVHVMSCQTFVHSGARLSIEAGTTIFANPDGMTGTGDTLTPPTLIVLKGAQIDAQGTAAAPITFTSYVDGDPSIENRWGGIFLLGNAPTSAATPKEVVGVTADPTWSPGAVDTTYGGNDESDSSGTLVYVRVWHGGRGSRATISGITLAGVGSGTTIHHCEVAHFLDDGFTFLGGTVNVRYLSSIFNGRDAFSAKEGYQGKGQFLFAMTGSGGRSGADMSSMTNGMIDSMPRTHPAFWSMTIIGGGSDSAASNLLRLHSGTGGSFGNSVIAGFGAFAGILSKCKD